MTQNKKTKSLFSKTFWVYKCQRTQKIHWNQQLTWDQRKLLKQIKLTREFPKYLLKVPWGDESLDCDLSGSRQLPLSWGRVLCPVSSGCQQLSFCFQFTHPRRSCHSRLFPLKSCDFFPAELPFSSHLKFHFTSVGELNVTHSEPYSLTHSTPVWFQPLVFSFFLFFFCSVKRVQWCEISSTADNKVLIKAWSWDVIHFYKYTQTQRAMQSL